MILGLSGRKHSGKDTTAVLLVKELDFVQMSFAGPLGTRTALTPDQIDPIFLIPYLGGKGINVKTGKVAIQDGETITFPGGCFVFKKWEGVENDPSRLLKSPGRWHRRDLCTG